jgi:multiple sugar transport system ATP-binding protein
MIATFLGNPPMNILTAKLTAEGFDVGGQILPCHSNLREILHSRIGQEFDLGIRPEHLSIVNKSQVRVPSTSSLKEESEELFGELIVEVKLIEPLGRETLVRVGLPNTGLMINVILVGDIRPQLGERLLLEFDASKLLIFDCATGDKIYQ